MKGNDKMGPCLWVIIKSYQTGEFTKFKHYAQMKNGRATARCGMVDGSEARGWRHRLFRRKCVKCRVSEAADIKKGIV